MAENNVKVVFYMGDDEKEQDLEAGFIKSHAHNNNAKKDLEAPTTHMDDNEKICDHNVNKLTKLFRVLCDLF